MFVSFEGIDGSGKSTQVELFIRYLEKKGIEFIKVREPGGTELGEKIRQILINDDMCPRSELLLFLSSRAQLVEKVIKPALMSGKIVVADRFAHSSIAYQGCGRGLGVETVELLNDFATDRTYPDVVFYIDVPVNVALERMGKILKKDRIEREKRDFWEKIRECYMELSRKDDRFIIIDGTEDVETIHKEIIQKFEELYRKLSQDH